MPVPFALSLSKGKRNVFQQPARDGSLIRGHQFNVSTDSTRGEINKDEYDMIKKDIS
jgi:hypothetical protein